MNYKTRESTEWIVVHNSATSPSMDVDVHWLRRVHREKNWLDIGYHQVITRDGRLQIGRPQNAMGAHVWGHNHNSLGICLAGGIAERPAVASDPAHVRRRGFVALPEEPEDNFTDVQFVRLMQTLRVAKANYPDAQIVGHGDLDHRKPHCPGFDLHAFLEEHGLS